MRAFLSIVAVVLFFMLISCSSTESSPTSASGTKSEATIQSTDVAHFSFATSGLVYNACTSENVSYTGSLKLTFKTKDQGNGETSRAFTSDIKAKGVGSNSGTKYEVMSTSGSTTEFELGPPYPSTFTFELKRKLVSQGSADNATITFVNTIETDENGNVVSSSIEAKTECR